MHMIHTLLMPVLVRDMYASYSQSPYMATFHIDSTEFDRFTTPEKKCSWLHLSARLSGRRTHLSFTPNNNYCSSALKPSIYWWTWYINLLGTYLQHVISTFNTCSRVSTHQSITGIDGGYNFRGVGFLHHSPRPSQLMVLCFPLMTLSGLKLILSA
jgi:hypothetical protein